MISDALEDRQLRLLGWLPRRNGEFPGLKVHCQHPTGRHKCGVALRVFVPDVDTTITGPTVQHDTVSLALRFVVAFADGQGLLEGEAFVQERLQPFLYSI